MANYQWVGGTGNTISKYDWNTAANWRKQVWNPAGYWDYQTTTTCPGAEDVAGIGAVFASNLDCHSPLLYGGYTGTPAAGGWQNSLFGTAGHTYNSAITSVKIAIPYGVTASYLPYPFPYIGGGLTGAIYDWVSNTYGLTTVTDEFGMTSQINNGGLSGISFSIADSKTETLRLKTKTVEGDQLASNKFVGLHFVKNWSLVDGSTGSQAGGAGATNAAIINNIFNFSNGGVLYVNGGAWASFNAYPDYSGGLSANPRLTVSNSVCQEINTKSHTFLFDNSVTAGKFTVQGGNFYPQHGMFFASNLDMQSILQDFYPAGGLTGTVAVNDSTIVLESPTTYGYRYPFATFTLGDFYGKTKGKCGAVIANSIQSSNAPIYTTPWSVEFAGDYKVNTLRSISSTISASSLIARTAKVEIGNLYLDGGSMLDFGSFSPFDGWQIGSATGSAGGIFFEDEQSQVIGSRGMRMWVSQTEFAGRVDTRLFTTSKSGKDPLSGTPESV